MRRRSSQPRRSHRQTKDIGPSTRNPLIRNLLIRCLRATVANSVASEPELTLIFNDGHREAIHNYVLTHDALIVMDQAASGRQQQIPLASLNLPATEQAAQQAGLDFSPPA